MYHQYGSTHIFRMGWIPRNLIVLAWVCGVPCLIFLGIALQSQGSGSPPKQEQFVMILVIGFFMMLAIHLLWTRVIPIAKKAIVLQVDPGGVSSYYLHGAIIGWADLLDIKIDTYPYKARNKNIAGIPVTVYWGPGARRNSGRPAGLKITFILRENSPSWLAIPRPWIFWRSSSIDIALIALPAEEQVQAVLALRAAFARYGGETAYQLMRGIRQEEMAQAFEGLAGLPEDLRHPDFSLPPRDVLNAKPDSQT
jgi:hypothetical protein